MTGVDGELERDWKPLWMSQARNLWRESVRLALDVVLPPLSYDGGQAVGAGGLSAGAWAKITFLEDPVCDGCALPYAHDGAGFGVDRCAACVARPHVFARARASCLYDEASRGLILGLKHGDQQQNAGLFAHWISRAATPLLEDADVIIPVPLHPLRLLRRRYNQSAEIARPLARQAGLQYLPDTLRRMRMTASQGGKSGAGRARNVQNAFAISARAARHIKGRHVLLVDDVLTTGATANACAKVLLAAGARQVDLAVVAGVHGGREIPK